MFANHFIPLINKPTRLCQKSATLIDNIFTNQSDAESLQGLFFTDITDHLPIFAICNSIQVNNQPQFITKRICSDANVNDFIQRLQTVDWNRVTQTDDPQIAYSVFHTELQQAYMQSFPVKTIKLNYRNRKTWLTEGLKKCIKLKNKMYVRNKRFPTRNMNIAYKQYKNKLNSILENAERDHYDKLFDTHKNNIKKSWEIISEIINNKSSSKGKKATFHASNGGPLSDGEVADQFNNFFVNVGPTLANKIPNTSVDPLSYIRSVNEESILLNHVTSDEVTDIIKGLRNSSPGWDEISAKIVKKTYSHFLIPLTYVCNLSITKGCFPKELKLARVIPLYKIIQIIQIIDQSLL